MTSVIPELPELHLPWLEFSILIPLVGSLFCARCRDRELSQKIAVILASAALIATVGEWIDFVSLGTWSAHDHWDFLHLVFGRDIFVIDELNAPLLPLTALLFLMTMLSTLRTKANRFSFGMTLLSEAVALATLSCHEKSPWVMISLLSVAVLPPWLELRQRGRSTRIYCIHMGLFVVLLSSGWALIELFPGKSGAPLIPTIMLTMAALLRVGVVPVHCWLTDLFENATFGTALLFVTPMTGAYAVMHLVLPVAPDWAMRIIALLSLVTAVYAAGMALVQKDARRYFSYLFLSHSSLVLAGMEVVTEIGITGAMCVWMSVGLSLGGFGLVLRSIEARIGRFSLDRFHGLYDHTPTLASLFLLTGLASIGFPGTIGFVGMDLLVEGAVEVYPLVGTAVIVAAALNSIAVLRGFFRIFTGVSQEVTFPLHSRPAERIAGITLTLLILGGGLWPQPGVASRFHAATSLMRHRAAAMREQREAWVRGHAEEPVADDIENQAPAEPQASASPGVNESSLQLARQLQSDISSRLYPPSQLPEGDLDERPELIPGSTPIIPQFSDESRPANPNRSATL